MMDDGKPNVKIGWSKLWTVLFKTFGWLSVLYVVFGLVYGIDRICYWINLRSDINQNPGYIEAEITRIADPTRGGLTVYYDYRVNDSIIHGFGRPGNKTVKTLYVGRKIPIKYDKNHPSHSIINL